MSAPAFPSSSAAQHFIGHTKTLSSFETHMADNTRTHFPKPLTQHLNFQAWQTNRTPLQSGSHRQPPGALSLESLTASFVTTVVPCLTTSPLCYSWSQTLGFLGAASEGCQVCGEPEASFVPLLSSARYLFPTFPALVISCDSVAYSCSNSRYTTADPSYTAAKPGEFFCPRGGTWCVSASDA